MAPQITVKELREQLERMERLGYGDAKLWFRDWEDIDHEVEVGIYDTYERENVKNVVLG